MPLATAVAVAIAASCTAFFLIHNLESGRTRATFEQLADERFDQLQERVRKVLGDARAIAMFFSSSVYVTRQEFETFVSPILTDEPGIRGVFWFPQVTADNRYRLEQQARSEGLSDFAVRMWGSNTPVPASEPRLHYPLYHVYPYDSFAGQLGWDLLTEPVRADALRRAVAMGQASLSAPLLLSADGGEVGYFLLVPVLQSYGGGPTETEIRRSVVGLVGALLDVGQIIGQSPLAVASPNVQLALLDPGGGANPILLWSTSVGSGAEGATPVDSSGGNMVLKRAIAAADRRLEAVAVPSALFERQHRPWVSWLVLSLGIAGTALFTSYGIFLRGRTVAARRHAAEMQAVLSRLEEEMQARLRAEERLRASEKMEAIGRLAGGIAHDFNNLLQVILGNVQLLLMRAEARGESLAATTGGELKEIEKAAQLAAGLTRKLLTFARPDSGEAQILRLDEQIAEMMPLFERTTPDNVLTSFFPWGDDAGGLGHPHLDPGLAWTARPTSRPLVKLDPLQLQQVALNLVINAAESMPAGGQITIAVSVIVVDELQARAHVEIPPGHYAVLEVRDTGQGMDPETMNRIFEPFFTTKEHGHGTGLGLATVYGIVKRAGGYIEVESEVAKGSSFKIYLPLVSQEVPQNKSRSESGGGRIMEHKATVLVVEDNEAVRRLAVRILSGAGYTVWEAADAAEALKLVEEAQEGPDLLLTDLSMPGMGGHELASKLCAQLPGLRVVFISGYADDAVQDAAFVGRAVFLNKPFTPAVLLERVSESLYGKDNSNRGAGP
ncbi:MAG: CHASE domain-containing protein [Thermoleophilia bacterium]|nr:CHASE domain-containing protein [Thermoleophilia bacterium]